MTFKCDKCGYEIAAHIILSNAKVGFEQGNNHMSFGLVGADFTDAEDVVRLLIRPKCSEAFCEGIMVPVKEPKEGRAAAVMEGAIAGRIGEKTFFVNGVATSRSWNFILYRGVVDIAFPSASRGALFTVTWSKKDGAAGSLKRDGKGVLDIEDGMIFDVTETGN